MSVTKLSIIIQWIRKYAVVPELGNIHGRLALNSMFLVISGLFTFQKKDVLIFPLNVRLRGVDLKDGFKVIK